MKYNERETALYIREKSDPILDQREAVESNARLLDSLYRLTFTADKLPPGKIDELINSLQRKSGEVKVLLARIKQVHEKGFKLNIFSDSKSQ